MEVIIRRIEQIGFDPVGPAQAPRVAGDLVDEFLFHSGPRMVLGHKTGQKLVVFSLIFRFENDSAACEAMSRTVQSAYLLAGRATGAGREQRILVIGPDLINGCHR